MIWTIITAIVTALLCVWLGYKRLVYLHQLSTRNLLISLMIAVGLYSVMLLLFNAEILSEALAGTIITNVYAAIFGFFTGSAFEQYRTREKAGDVMYINRTFTSEYLPVIIALSLIMLGMFRTSLISGQVLTPIRLFSGLSLVAIGFWGYTIRVVPEFRKEGIIVIDSLIEWEDFLGYKWYGEEVLEIEFMRDEVIQSFKTLVPAEDQVKVEELLRKQMLEKLEES